MVNQFRESSIRRDIWQGWMSIKVKLSMSAILVIMFFMIADCQAVFAVPAPSNTAPPPAAFVKDGKPLNGEIGNVGNLNWMKDFFEKDLPMALGRDYAVQPDAKVIDQQNFVVGVTVKADTKDDQKTYDVRVKFTLDANTGKVTWGIVYLASYPDPQNPNKNRLEHIVDGKVLSATPEIPVPMVSLLSTLLAGLLSRQRQAKLGKERRQGRS